VEVATVSKPLFVNSIVGPQDAPDVGVTVTAKAASEVMLAAQNPTQKPPETTRNLFRAKTRK